MRSHTGEKPYQCLHCEKNLSVNILATTHSTAHTRKKLIRYSQCNKAFGSISNLSHYLITYTSEMSYHCSLCNNFFTNIDNI